MPNPRLRFQVGEILWAELPYRVPPGHEQIGHRPVVVVGMPESIQSIPYRVLIVVPLTCTRLTGPLFPLIRAGTGGLPADSVALVYQVSALDARRMVGRLGRLSEQELSPIKEGLKRVFGFG
ncbi:type II toxin-antitoxin system PemK/MazF family toxin [Candidatus Poribacteria bacterium]|nr:type II toxin-antitoxin system PemK/MazF family toxin [Candidatus Poribacteria bacterium]